MGRWFFVVLKVCGKSLNILTSFQMVRLGSHHSTTFLPCFNDAEVAFSLLEHWKRVSLT